MIHYRWVGWSTAISALSSLIISRRSTALGKNPLVEGVGVPEGVAGRGDAGKLAARIPYPNLHGAVSSSFLAALLCRPAGVQPFVSPDPF